MKLNSWFMLLIWLFVAHSSLAAGLPQIKALKAGAKVEVDRFIGDDKVVLSVADAAKNPLLGLTLTDFAILAGSRAARIVSVRPFEESLEVPRHIVLVLDNSESMRERNAVAPLLAGVDELLKIVRPVDQVQIVAFTSTETLPLAGRDLHVKTFRSNDPVALKRFVDDLYRDGMTPTTVLHEALLAGVEIVRTLPVDEPRFLVVFSDGEDINSTVKRQEVSTAAGKVPRFDAFAIDYMPGPATDKFLTEFAGQNHGQIWKATSETTLVPIFQSVASRMQHYYVLNYLFPPTGRFSIQPASIAIDELQSLPAPRPDGPVETQAAESRYFVDAAQLVAATTIDSDYGLTRWVLSAANGSGPVATLSGEGPPPATLAVPLPPGELGRLASGGDIAVTMAVTDRKGQVLQLSAAPVKVSLHQTSGRLGLAPQALTIEEVKTLDASPMLGQIFFAEGSAALPDQYVQLAGPDATAGFDEQGFRDTLDKYYQVLNIIGRRLQANPEATITLVGCNAHQGGERNNKTLSAARAGTVASYLQAVWGIDPGRIAIETRNLPETPSTSRLEEGRADNRRVEIHSNHPAILDLARSTYLAMRSDAKVLTVQPVITAAHGVANWSVTVANTTGQVALLSGDGPPPAELSIPLPVKQLEQLANGGALVATMLVRDGKGRELNLEAAPATVNFIQTSQRMASKEGYRVQEKYALILFDFDSDTLDARNQAIVDAISARIRELPDAMVEITGHTDNIGKEAYNLKLSERRAKAVYRMLSAAWGENPGDRFRFSGVGLSDPLYNNGTSEGRAFNRTVTITLEYLAIE